MSKQEERVIDQNVTGWLYQKLENGQVQVTSAEAEYVLQSKEWLADINQGKVRLVRDEEDTPDNPGGTS